MRHLVRGSAKPTENLHFHKQQKVEARLDTILLGVVILLTVIGLVAVYDASVIQALRDYNDKYWYIKQQVISVILGFGALAFFANFDYHNLRRVALPGFVIALILLVAVFIPGLGVQAGGAHRWLKIGVTVQPAEIIKLASIIFFAALFEKKYKIGPFLLSLTSVCLVLGILQKDLGSTIVYFLTSVVIFLIAGAPIRFFTSFIPTALIGFVLFVTTSEYRRARVSAFLDPFYDPQGASYHIYQVLLALGSGKFFGLGLGQSRQKFQYIPEVTTDSIFAIVGEELGFVGGILLISLISYLIYRGFRIAERAPDRFGQILGFGLVSWLGIQALVNLGAMVSVIPLTGVPLPFISYGGSAVLANLVAVGILLNISKKSRI